ncbi:MAG: glycosyl hydrolase family 17 protein [Candidatus Brocadiales bacterium]
MLQRCWVPSRTIKPPEIKEEFILTRQSLRISRLLSTVYYLLFLSFFTFTSLGTGVFITQPSYAQGSVTYKTHGLNFSPYIDGQDPNLGSVISEEQLRARMEIIAPYTEWIRTFGSSSGLEKAGVVAHDMGLKAAIGAWLSSNLSANDREISNLITAAKAGQVDMAIVGSEVMLRGDLSEAQLIGYINQVKAEVPSIPVTTADVYGEILSHPAVVSAVDVVLVNYYPYWEGIRVECAIAAIHDQHQQVTAVAGGKPVIVSETGWPSGGNRVGDAIPSPENASFYFLNFVSWARTNNVPYFYFEAFDETWKANYEGPQGAHWGVWNKCGELKLGMKDVFDGKTMPDNWSSTAIPGGSGIPTIEFPYVPPYGSFENLQGQVWHVKPADYKVAVYIKVGGGWWTKPFFGRPLTSICPGGSWTCDITTGGDDQNATKIAAYLVPNGYSPPLMRGGPTLPAELDQNAVAKVETIRTPGAATTTTTTTTTTTITCAATTTTTTSSTTTTTTTTTVAPTTSSTTTNTSTTTTIIIIPPTTISSTTSTTTTTTTNTTTSSSTTTTTCPPTETSCTNGVDDDCDGFVDCDDSDDCPPCSRDVEDCTNGIDDDGDGLVDCDDLDCVSPVECTDTTYFRKSKVTFKYRKKSSKDRALIRLCGDKCFCEALKAGIEEIVLELNGCDPIIIPGGRLKSNRSKTRFRARSSTYVVKFDCKQGWIKLHLKKVDLKVCVFDLVKTCISIKDGPCLCAEEEFSIKKRDEEGRLKKLFLRGTEVCFP